MLIPHDRSEYLVLKAVENVLKTHPLPQLQEAIAEFDLTLRFQFLERGDVFIGNSSAGTKFMVVEPGRSDSGHEFNCVWLGDGNKGRLHFIKWGQEVYEVGED